MPNRRDLIKGALVAGSAAAIGGGVSAAKANWGMPTSAPIQDFDRRSLVNKPQVYKVLEQEGLDGLVAVNPVNVFYFGNHLGYYNKIQQREASFTVFPRDKNKPSILVVGSGDLWKISNEEREYPKIIPYSVASNWQDFVGMDAAITEAGDIPGAYPGFSNFWAKDLDGITPIEENWIAIDESFDGEFMPTAGHALVKALKEAGLESAKVAVDDFSISHTLLKAGHESTVCVDGDNVFRKIRVVKSDVEVEHMRTVAQANQTAAMNMLAQLDIGATNHDMDHIFQIEAAKQGAMFTWLAGGSTAGFPGGELREGVPFLIDAVSQINYYCGDFGRTVVCGDPTKKIRDRANILNVGWQAALNMMRPGVRYSEIETVARKAMSGSGLAMPSFAVVPHSVGLQHTDEPYRDNLPFVVKDDLVLEENMTLTVDFPSLELGWGNCHLEDLVRITKDGVEALGTIDDPLVVI